MYWIYKRQSGKPSIKGVSRNYAEGKKANHTGSNFYVSIYGIDLNWKISSNRVQINIC